jgi:hypothetical protein
MLIMLGGFSEEALQLFQLAASEQSYEFSESEGTYDFTRCMRADGSFYGTRGSCKKGSAAGAKEKEAPKTEGGRKRSATAAAKAAGAAERKAAGAAKRSATAGRARLLQEELEKVKDKMRGADSETQNRLLKEASAAADKRHAAGEGAKTKTEGAAPKPARKPRATTAETKPAWQETEKAVKAAKAELKKVGAETKGDKSPEAQKRRLEAGRALDRAERAAEKAAARYGAAQKRESYARMTPEQKKEEREWRKHMKMYG